MTDDELIAIKRELKQVDWSEEAVILGKEQGFRCWYCGRDLLASIEDYDVWQFDHIIPTSKGGPDTIENKAIACKLCNFAKRDFDVEQVAGRIASKEELREYARPHIRQKLQDKREKLSKAKAILRKFKWIHDDRALDKGV